MSPFEHIQAVWKDPAARRGSIERAAGREPLLLRLGRLYGQRFLVPADSATQPADWQLRELESQVGMRASADPAAPEEDGWVGHVVAGLVGVADPQSSPEAVLILGQSGTGKGVVAEELCQYFLPRGGCVVVDRYDLQYLHPKYAALLGPDDRDASRAVFADVVDLVEALYHRALAGKRNLVLDGSLMDASSASVAVRELHAQGYRTSVLVLCAPPDVSWRATQERHEDQRRMMGVGRWVDRENHDESCRDLLATLRALEEQGLADAIHLLTREGEGLLSCFRDRSHVPGRAEQRVRACWNPASTAGTSPVAPSPPATPSAVIVAGGRKVKIGTFRAAAPPAPPQQGGPEQPRKEPKGVKMGAFAPALSDTAAPAREPVPEKAPVPEGNAAPPSAHADESAASTVRQAGSGAGAAEERAIQRRRMLQAKLRSKVKPREENG
jgi:predicted kinase